MLRLWKQEEQWHKGKENISLAQKLCWSPPFFHFLVFPGLTTILKLLDSCSLWQKTTKLSEGKDQMSAWRRFYTSSSSINACPHFALASQADPVFTLLWNLGYVSAVPQVPPQELVSCPVLIPFTHSEQLSASTISAAAAGGFAPPVPKAVSAAVNMKQQEQLQSNARHFLLSSGRSAHCPGEGQTLEISWLSSAATEAIRLNSRQISALHMLILSTFLSLKVLQLKLALFSCNTYWIVKYLKARGAGWCFEGNKDTFKLPNCFKCYPI